MKSIKKRQNGWMLALALALICLVFILLYLSKEKGIFTTNQELANVGEVNIMVEALAGTADFTHNYVDETPITYKMLQEYLAKLPNGEEFAEQYTKDNKMDKEITKEAWEKMAEKLLERYNLESSVFLYEADVIYSGQKEAGETGTMVTLGETITYCLQSAEPIIGEEVLGYAVKQNGQIYLIGIREKSQKPMEVNNCWVKGEQEELANIFFQGTAFLLPKNTVDTIHMDSIADITIAEGTITKLEEKSQKTNDKVLVVNDNSITLENMGTVEFTPDMQIYKIYDTLENASKTDIILGYRFVDFVMENGKICACLITRSEEMQEIRVLLKTEGFAGNYHESLTVTADTDYKVIYVKKDDTDIAQSAFTACQAGEEITITPEDFTENRTIYVQPDALTGKVEIASIQRAKGAPAYHGNLEIRADSEEGLVVINNVLLEEYLYAVVPSEMPASYPEEALMAQAVCARTYAYEKMKKAGLSAYGAHVDDSTAFQVYGNIAEDTRTTEAVRKSSGKVLLYDGQPIEASYYSTSCGFGTDGSIWGEAPYLQAQELSDKACEYTAEQLTSNEYFDAYIKNSYEEDFEVENPWYRWHYNVAEIDVQQLIERIKDRYDASASAVLTLQKDGSFSSESLASFGNLEDMFVAERAKGGAAVALILNFENSTLKVCGEYNIRYVLVNSTETVAKQDESTYRLGALLPSSFFSLQTSKSGTNVIGYNLLGGGFGHGAGMSQNGAAAMAKEGYTCSDILNFFYQNCSVEEIY